MTSVVLAREMHTLTQLEGLPGRPSARGNTCFCAGLVAAFLSLAGFVWAANAANALVTFDAESGSLGGNFTNGTAGGIQFISISTDSINSGNPGSSSRVATYTVTFPAAGAYNLYARVRVGAGGYNDDSLFYGNGFGAKSPTADGDWMLVNGLAAGGFTAAGDVVAGNGVAGAQVWKWVNLSQFNPSGSATETPITFNVPAGSLTQTFQIGARENGFDMDKCAFGTLGIAFTVSNLDTGTLPASATLTNSFVGPEGSTLHRFNPLSGGLNLDGANPASGLGLAGNVLFGTTLNGGLQGLGTVFSVSLDGANFNTVRSFATAPDAGNPQGNLLVSGGSLFGASLAGGSSGAGAVFVGSTNGSLAVLRSFAAVSADTATNSGGASPGALVAVPGSALYGTATTGGPAANGTLFSLSTNGSSFAVLHQFGAFDSSTGTNSDGALPCGGLALFGDTLYGTASAGGIGGAGVVFSLSTNGGNFTLLHSFSPLDAQAATNSDGAFPIGGVILANGTLYGTTIAGGSGGKGVVYSLGTNGLGFTVLHHFSATAPLTGTNLDGASPCSVLALSGRYLYGTASAGGTGGSGTVFSVGTNGAGFQVLYAFMEVDASTGTNRDGACPVAGVLPLASTLYGTTFAGGPGGVGTVFTLPIRYPPALITNMVLNPDGSVTVWFLGGPNSTNVIQAANALASPVGWQNVATNLADANGVWRLTESLTNRSRFYRSYVP